MDGPVTSCALDSQFPLPVVRLCTFICILCSLYERVREIGGTLGGCVFNYRYWSDDTIRHFDIIRIPQFTTVVICQAKLQVCPTKYCNICKMTYNGIPVEFAPAYVTKTKLAPQHGGGILFCPVKIPFSGKQPVSPRQNGIKWYTSGVYASLRYKNEISSS